MTELQAAVKIALANTFVMYFKAHSYHWNVEGPMFSMYHDFFGDLYSDLHSAVDATAEELRTTGAYAPINLSEMYQYRTIMEDSTKPFSALEMVRNLIDANELTIQSLNKLFEVATQENNQGLADFAAGRLDTHAKHGWMLASFTK